MSFTIAPSVLTERDVEQVYKTGPAQRRGRTSEKPLLCPFTVAIDTREQAPYSFASIHADSNRSYRPLTIDTQRITLYQGDYSIIGQTHAIAIERKSKQDLFGTLSAGRERFEQELHRLSECVIWSCVIVEAEWSEILSNPPEFSGLHPKTVFRSVLAWEQRFPSVHWKLVPNRRIAEQTTFRMLERWWRDRQKQLQGEEVETDLAAGGVACPTIADPSPGSPVEMAGPEQHKRKKP